jgi:hypothetical protein
VPNNPFPPAKATEIEDRYRQEIGILDRALAALDESATAIDGRPIGGMSREQYFVLFHCIKAAKTAQAIRHLFLGGYDEDAEMLLRVLVEQAITVRWAMQEDSDARVRAYMLSLKENRLRRLRVAQGFIPIVQIPPSLVEEIEREGAEYKALGKNEKWRAITGEVSSIAAAAGVSGSYAIHITGSSLIHSNPAAERNYVRVDGEQTHFNAVPCMPSDGWTPVLAAKHLLWLGDALAKVFDLTEPEQSNQLHEEIDKYNP